MIVYRITHSLYKDDLSGSGAKAFGARWNQAGSSMLYTAEHISLCSLELLVHLGWQELQKNFHLLSIYLPEDSPVKILEVDKLKKGWPEDPDYTAFIGTEFLKLRQHLVMKVPSAVVPDEFNFLVNPLHPDFKKVKIKKNKPFIFDQRLSSFK